ncbi:MAG: HD-GYP domain-containing protein [Fervidobacterium sp.]|uniref:HD-GYP domain-containing protein n=1 Tax=Fervidobacterium sp. TaxID=1871331 RepID=UPI00404AFA60
MRELAINFNGTICEVDSCGSFWIYGQLPSQDDVYEMAIVYELKIAESIFDLTYNLLTAVSLEEIPIKVSAFFEDKFNKSVRMKYDEELHEFKMKNEQLVVPIVSKNSGTLGSVIIDGVFKLEEALGFLAFYDSFVSIVEGIIINHRLENLLRSALDTMFITLNKRVRLEENDLRLMEEIVSRLSAIEDVNIDEAKLALRTVNVGFVGLRDELFDRIKVGAMQEGDYEEFLKHVQYGYEILKDMDAPNFIIEACLYHHEFLDGSGLNKLKGDEIPKLALVVGFAENIVLLKRSKEELKEKYPAKYSKTIFGE